LSFELRANALKKIRNLGIAIGSAKRKILKMPSGRGQREKEGGVRTLKCATMTPLRSSKERGDVFK
jgi:hypothetical protein